MWGLVAFVVLLAAGLFVYVRTRPLVSEAELEAALEHVETVRAALDNAECTRPPILGPAVTQPRDFSQVLKADGEFAECWQAAHAEEVTEYIGREVPEDYLLEPDAHSQRAPKVDSPLSQEVIESLLSSCSALADEVRHAARTPNRCTPNPPSSEGWRRQHERDFSAWPSIAYGRVMAITARFAEMGFDDRLRLIVQAMAVARDLQQGPSGLLSAMLGVAAENHLGANFVALLESESPSSEAQEELHEALEVLASMPIDMHVLLASEGIAITDSARIYSEGSEEAIRYTVFAAATLLPWLMEKCPAGIGVDECIHTLSSPAPPPNEHIERYLGARAVRDDNLLVNYQNSAGSYRRYVDRLLAVRENARALQEILRWSAQRDAGGCPEESTGNIDDVEYSERFFVDAEGDTYRIVTPGGERNAFYFRCTLPETPDASAD